MFLDYTTGTEMERVNGIAPLSRPWHGRILLLNHTDNPTLRTRPLCALSYGDEFEIVRASGNAPEPGTHLVRCGV